jgi:hypothetical protein
MADEQFPLNQFLGGKIASQTQALAGMTGVEEELKRRFDAARESQAAQAEAITPLQKSLGDTLGPALEETIAGLQTLDQDLAARELAVPDLHPEAKAAYSVSPVANYSSNSAHSGR